MSRICLIGGGGFLGRNVAQLLARRQHALIVPTRRRERVKRYLITLPTVDVLDANVHDDATLDRLLAGCDAVVNFVGVLHSKPGTPYGPDFRRAHVELPQRIVAACRRQGVRRLLHVSALGADKSAPSEYQRSKADGESAVLGGGLDVTIFRPSVIFGPDDRFLNLFVTLQKFAPVVALGMADAQFQPVYVDDVAAAIVASLEDDASIGNAYALVGPKVYRLRELVAFAGEAAGVRRPIVALPDSLAMLQAAVLECLPGPLMSRDNVRSMRVPNVSSEPFPFGIRPQALDAVAPAYLRGVSPRTRFDRFRHRAGRL